MSSDLGSAASYSFAAGSSGIPPAFSSRRTSASVLSSSANSVHQSAVMAAGPSAAAASGGGGGSYRNSNPSSAFAAAATRSVSTTSTVGGGGGGIGGRFASFTSTTTPIDEGNTSYTSSIHPTSTSASSTIRPGPDIIERPRDKIRQAEVSLSSLSFLFSEIVSYTQNRVTGVTDLEKRLSLIGYTVGQRILALTMHRQEMANNPKNPKRETKLLPTLLWIHTSFWKAAFGKPADSLERSTEAGRGDECKCPFPASFSLPQPLSADTRSMKKALVLHAFVLHPSYSLHTDITLFP